VLNIRWRHGNKLCGSNTEVPNVDVLCDDNIAPRGESSPLYRGQLTPKNFLNPSLNHYENRGKTLSHTELDPNDPGEVLS
jgi:hypothetical protein